MADPTEKAPPRCTFHPSVETRLTCSECETPICPKCAIPYEVGQKCKRCAGKTQSHLLQVSVKDIVLAATLATFLGWAYGTAAMLFPMPFLFLKVLIAYWLGHLSGQLIQRSMRHKMGTPLFVSTLLGGMMGLLTSPFGMVIISALSALIFASELFFSLANIALLLQGVLFLFALSRPFYYRS